MWPCGVHARSKCARWQQDKRAKSSPFGGTTPEGKEQRWRRLDILEQLWRKANKLEGRRTELQEGEDFAPTPPDTPVPKEARPALPTSSLRSDTLPTPTDAFDVVPAPSKASSFSDVELSLLKERRITEITPGNWMYTQEQADGRIIARMRFISRNVNREWLCARGLLYVLSSINCSVRKSAAITFPMPESEGKRILLPSLFLLISSVIRPMFLRVL